MNINSASVEDRSSLPLPPLGSACELSECDPSVSDASVCDPLDCDPWACDLCFANQVHPCDFNLEISGLKEKVLGRNDPGQDGMEVFCSRKE